MERAFYCYESMHDECKAGLTTRKKDERQRERERERENCLEGRSRRRHRRRAFSSHVSLAPSLPSVSAEV